MGEVEVEFEGSESFLKDELKELLAGVIDLHKTSDMALKTPPAFAQDSGGQGSGGDSNEVTFNGTTNSVAAKLNSKSGPDLVIAAITRATLVSKQDTCDRGTIIKEMKAATSYFNKSYVSNLSVALKGLLKDQKIREISTGTYALSANELQRVKASLAN